MIGEYVREFEEENPGFTSPVEVPEMQIFNNNVINDQEHFRNSVAPQLFAGEKYALTSKLPLSNTARVLDILDVYLCHGQLNRGFKNKIISTWPSMTEQEDFVNVLDAVYNSPGFVVTH